MAAGKLSLGNPEPQGQYGRSCPDVENSQMGRHETVRLGFPENGMAEPVRPDACFAAGGAPAAYELFRFRSAVRQEIRSQGSSSRHRPESCRDHHPMPPDRTERDHRQDE